MANKKFDIYIKKNIFTIFFSSILLLLFFYMYKAAEENSLDKLDAKIDRYTKSFNDMQRHIEKANRSFGLLKTKVSALERFLMRYECSSNIQTKESKYFIVFDQKSLDISRNVNILYDIDLRYTSISGFYSYLNYSYLGNDKIELNFIKDSPDLNDSLGVFNICVLLIGYKTTHKDKYSY